MKIIQRWKIWIAVSALMLVPGLVALGLWGLNLGIDFKGGTLIEVSFPDQESIDIEAVKNVFAEKGIEGGQFTKVNDNSFIARTHVFDTEKHREISAGLNEKIGESEEVRFEVVGPTVSGKFNIQAVAYGILLPLSVVGLDIPSNNAITAIGAVFWACIAIVLYIAWAFRTVPKGVSSWKFGMSAIVALVHDILIVVGVFAILGHYLGVEVDSLFITALLTVMGFSVHDTIVVFDRIRENLRKSGGDLVGVANLSIGETMTRSINTSATTLFALLALLLFGGSSIFWFVLALVIGITVGTYSSIFIASVVMVLWHGNKIK